MNITESIKFDKLQEENETLKKELDKKDKYIKNLEKEWEKLVCEKYDLQQQKLYKEDFKQIANTSFSSKGHTSFPTWELKDNSLYDKLPSKDVK